MICTQIIQCCKGKATTSDIQCWTKVGPTSENNCFSVVNLPVCWDSVFLEQSAKMLQIGVQNDIILLVYLHLQRGYRLKSS